MHARTFRFGVALATLLLVLAVHLAPRSALAHPPPPHSPDHRHDHGELETVVVEDPPARRLTAFWVSAGTAAVLLVGGGLLLHDSNTKLSAVERGLGADMHQADALDLEESARGSSLGGWILIGFGSAAALGAVTVLITYLAGDVAQYEDADHLRTSPVAFGVTPVGGGGLLTVGADF